MRRDNVRRIGAGAAVLLLHVALLSAFLVSNYARTISRTGLREIEIRFPPTVVQPSPAALRALLPKFLSPTAPVPPVLPGQLFAPREAPSPVPGAIPGVGRALFGCDPQKLDLLSPQNRAECLHLSHAKSSAASLRMPPSPDPNSPFTKEIEERFRDAVPINRPCPLGSFNDTHGLPCFGFDEASSGYPSR